MSEQQCKEAPTPRQRGLEMLLFLVVSAIGIYALGNGLIGLFEPGRGFNLLWLAVAGAAMMILFAQMGRVHDSWPRRRDRHTDQAQPATYELRGPLTTIQGLFRNIAPSRVPYLTLGTT